MSNMLWKYRFMRRISLFFSLIGVTDYDGKKVTIRRAYYLSGPFFWGE